VELKRPVLDRTVVAGRYNFELSWTPELAPCAEATDNAPSIFTLTRPLRVEAGVSVSLLALLA
jgi:uncharacterized protein (TIGR03435 family)